MQLASWRVPSFAILQGTTLGARDFETYSRGFGFGNRFGVRGGQLVPLSREAWRVLRMEDQFNALLYLGPPSSMTNVTVPAALCQDSAFVSRRLQRLIRFAPPVEVANFKKACSP
jgi:hypothetical protein